MAGLPRQNVPVVLAGGVDTKTDKKVVQPGRLLVLENGRFTKLGTISKRFGYDDLGTGILGGGKIASGKAMGVFLSELALMDGNRLYSYVQSNDAWADRGLCTVVGVKSSQIIRNTAAQSLPDVATAVGVAVYAWEDTRGGVRASVVDLSSGLPIQADVLISSNGSKPKCSATPNYIYIHYYDTGNNLKVRRLNPRAPLSFDAAATIAGDMNNTNPNFDVAIYGQNLVLAYETTGNVVTTGFIKADGTFGTALDGFPSPVSTTQSGSGAITVSTRLQGDLNDGVYLFYHNTTNGLRCRIFNTDLTTAYTTTIDSITTVVNQITALVDGAQCGVWYEVNNATVGKIRIKADSITRAGVAAGGGSGVEFIRSLGISGKAFKAGDGNTYLVANFQSSVQSTYFTLRHISTSRAFVVNNIAPNVAGGGTVKRSHVPNVSPIDTSSFLFANLITSRLVSDSGSIYGQVGVQSSILTVGDRDFYQTKTLGQNMHIGGGMLLAYDGRTVFESGYNLFPDTITNAITTTTGAITAGTRQYCALYEWTDNQGQIHQSAPSIAISVTNANNDKNTVTIPTLRATERKNQSSRSDVSIVLYRTKAGLTTFYRASSVTSPTLNDVTADSVDILDNLTDTALASNERLYTTGSVLENIQPQSCDVIAEYRGRLVVNATEDSTLSQYSKPWAKDTAVEFNDALNFRTAQGGGAITAYRSLDEKLIIFKESSIFVQAGNGPTNTGALDDFQIPQILPSDVGCPFPESIVEFPGGLIFKSDKGFYALTRGLEAQHIGAPVEGFKDLTITSAVHVSDANEVRFFHSDGVAIFYDYFTNQWGTDTGLEAVSGGSWQGKTAVLKDDGRVFVENKNSYKDAGAPIKLRIVTPWLALAGIQAAQRIYRALFIGEYFSSHELRVKVAYDYREGTMEQFIYTPDTILNATYYGSDAYYGASPTNGSSDDQYQLEICPSLQKCEAIRFELDDLNPLAVDGAGFSITGLLLVCGVKTGPYRLPARKRVASS